MFLEKNVPESARDAYRRDALAGLLSGASSGIIGPFLGFIARSKLHASPELIGLISAAPFMGSLLTIVYANIAEGRKKMPFVAWPMAIGRIILLLVLWTTTPISFALVATLSQLTLTISGPQYAAVMCEIYPAAQRATIMAYIRIGATFMMFAFTAIAGKLLSSGAMSYNYVLPIGGLIGIASAVAFSTIKLSPTDADALDRKLPIGEFLVKTIGILKHDISNRRLAAAASFTGLGALMTMPLYPIFQVDKLGITATQLAILTNISTLAWMVSYPWWGRRVDSTSPHKVWLLTVLMSTAGPLNYFFATEWWHVIPGTLISGLTIGGAELSFFNTVLHAVRDGETTRYQALHAFVGGIRGVAGPFLGAGMITLFMGLHLPIKFIFLVGVALMVAGTAVMAKYTPR